MVALEKSDSRKSAAAKFAPRASADTKFAFSALMRSSAAERNTDSRKFAPRRSDSDKQIPSRLARHNRAFTNTVRYPRAYRKFSRFSFGPGTASNSPLFSVSRADGGIKLASVISAYGRYPVDCKNSEAHLRILA